MALQRVGGVELALRTELAFSRVRRRATFATAATLAGSLALAPGSVSAEGLFDFLFGGAQKPQARQAPAQANFFADPFGTNQPAHSAPAPRVAGSGPAFCVRSCDGKYFPLTMRGNATPVQTCQAFCPASVTKVFYGSHIDSATAGNGERYADSENAFAYRKALRADCTCNGRSPSGLAPVDLTLDTSLRSGDVVATTDGLVAYTGVRLGADQTAEFTPVASYPGLTADVRARLGEMKVAPVSAEMVAGNAPLPEARRDDDLPTASIPKPAVPKAAKRAEVR
ncbi:hypothetical protein V1286_006467 [Bradyrhizobium algeriense]|uniref:DUF2865 domain-containing protein n=1 Tax=Bradyrhizobium algeriense TaxID=634784 RepID=A0ABU8BLV8_9BRAD